MPRLRRLTGTDIVKILQHFGFDIVRIRGSHHIMERVAEGKKQTVNIPVHRVKIIGPGLTKKLYRQLLEYIEEDELKSHFYAE